MLTICLCIGCGVGPNQERCVLTICLCIGCGDGPIRRGPSNRLSMQITMVPEPNYQSTLDDIEGEQSTAYLPALGRLKFNIC